MIASIHYHSRGHDLVELARLHNERTTQPHYLFDLTCPLQLAYEGWAYWYLRGTSTKGEAICAQWVQGHTLGRADYVEDLIRCNGIEWTEDAQTALDRLLEVERRRDAAKETP